MELNEVYNYAVMTANTQGESNELEWSLKS